ncbi:hypothetical protein Q1695_016354 [Nippostrongylus brasiliensis]|nr:hypothetical protein Q1695_016354 [Nippostrongylus brasiliensis]
MRFRRIIPNLPDVVLRRIFDFLSYKQLCKAEAVCRRWQTIVLSMMRRNIQEMIVEPFGSATPSVHQVIAFRRLTISCRRDALDFIAGVIRRSRLAIIRMTTDLEFLANLANVYVNKDEKRKYFSNVEELWLLVVDCNDDVTDRFLAIEDNLFSEILSLTVQVHLRTRTYANTARVINAFVAKHPKAVFRLEIHADKSSMIVDQLRELPPVSLRQVKIICTEFELPAFRISSLYDVMKERGIKAKAIGFRDWTLLFDGATPISPHPLDTLRISSCIVDSVDDFIKSLKLTAQQKVPKKKKRVVRPVDGVLKPKSQNAVEDAPSKPLKKVVKRKASFVKKLEVAGQCTLRGLQFLQSKAHEELEKRLSVTIPELVVDCEEIYYCW